MVKVALASGSSTQGKALLASVASIWVNTVYLKINQLINQMTNLLERVTLTYLFADDVLLTKYWGSLRIETGQTLRAIK